LTDGLPAAVWNLSSTDAAESLTFVHDEFSTAIADTATHTLSRILIRRSNFLDTRFTSENLSSDLKLDHNSLIANTVLRNTESTIFEPLMIPPVSHQLTLVRRGFNRIVIAAHDNSG